MFFHTLKVQNKTNDSNMVDILEKKLLRLKKRNFCEVWGLGILWRLSTGSRSPVWVRIPAGASHSRDSEGRQMISLVYTKTSKKIYLKIAKE